MAPVFDDTSSANTLGRGLLKQRSRRVLQEVLRKRMIIDATKGYNDELQYNTACRSLLSKTGQLSSVLEGLRQIRNKTLVNFEPVHFNMIQNRSGFLQPVSDFIKMFPATDRNANFVATTFVTKSGTAKPPMFVFSTPREVRKSPPPERSKNNARQAISNALFQSQGFADFFQTDAETPSTRQTQQIEKKTRFVPIVVESKQKTENRNVVKPINGNAPKCTSSIFVPISTAKKIGSRTSQGHTTQRNSSVKSLQAIKNDTAQTETKHHISQYVQPMQKVPIKSVTKVQPPTQQNAEYSTASKNSQAIGSVNNITTSPSNAASKFRIRKIRIAGQEQPNRHNGTGTNFVTGVKFQCSPEPETVSSNKYARQKVNEKTSQVQNSHVRTVGPNIFEKCDKNNNTDEKLDQKSCPDFIKGMTFSAKQGNQFTNRSSFQFQCPSYENKIRNKFSHSQVGAVAPPPQIISIPKYLPRTGDSVIDNSYSPNFDKEEKIPRFYFPTGKPRSTDEIGLAIQRISEAASCFENRRIPVQDMGRIAKACNLPLYWKGLLFYASADGPEATDVSESALISMWKRIAGSHHDAASRFVALLAKPGKNCLDFEDFLPILKDIIDTHPGLVFLKDAAEFHTRYMNTVIARIFYVINRSWTGQITVSEIRKSNFLTVLSILEEEDDINAITDYFSYEHFYVIYCKFWELDSDHDLVVDKHDLLAYGDGVLSSRLIERVLSGAVTRWDTSDHQLGRMSYVDFVWFILSEEDKKTPTSIEYWFRCMDLDGDGFVSMYEMEYFYDEQAQKLEQLEIEPLPFEDCVCQVFDIVNPSGDGKVSLSDLKRCKMAHVFYDTFFNVAKYLNNEQKDPFAAQNSEGGVMAMSDWDTFAAEEYEMLVAEEQSSKLNDVGSALLEDDEGIEVLEENLVDDSLLEEEKMRLHLTSGNQEGDINSEFTDLNFIEPPGAEKMTPLAQT